jgi:hypothetical protein
MTDLNALDIETIRGWASTGFLGFIAFTLARFASPIGAYMVKRLEVNAQERKDERDGYGPLIKTLTDGLAAVREQLAQCEQRHVTDVARIDQLEATVRGLNAVVVGKASQEAVMLPATTGDQREHMLQIAERSASAALDMISKERSGGNG